MKIGRILSDAVKIATVPLDICDAAMDCMTGGSGSKASREQMKDAVPCISAFRDRVCDVLKEIDD